MHRIDHATKDVDLFGSGKDGFTEGTPGTEAATVVTDDWLNGVQEELISPIEAVGIDLVKGTRNQLLDAMQRMFDRMCISNLEKLTPDTMSGDFHAVAASTTVIVAVGDGGVIQTSQPPNLPAWTNRTAGGSYSGDFYGATYALSSFIICGTGGEIQTGTLSTWTSQTPAGSYTNTFRGVAGSATAAILVGLGGEIQRTTNLTSYTEEKASGNDLYAVCYSADLNRFVAVGANGDIWTSDDDGLNWTQRTPAGSFSGTFYSVVWNPNDGKFYIAGGTGAAAEIQSSSDGITWAQESISWTSDVLYIGLIGHTVVASTGPYFFVRDSDGDWQVFYKRLLDEATPGQIYAGAFMTTHGLPVFVGNSGGLYTGLAFNRLA